LKRVKTQVRYADLVSNTDTTTISVRMNTSGHRTYLLQLSAGPGNRHGTVVIGRYTDQGVSDVQCSGVRKSVQYRRDQLVVSVPRRCLHRPDWVRYTGEATAIEEGPGAAYSDTFLSGDPVNDLFSSRIHRA
jgi:hypothetical protein